MPKPSSTCRLVMEDPISVRASELRGEQLDCRYTASKGRAGLCTMKLSAEPVFPRPAVHGGGGLEYHSALKGKEVLTFAAAWTTSKTAR